MHCIHMIPWATAAKNSAALMRTAMSRRRRLIKPVSSSFTLRPEFPTRRAGPIPYPQLPAGAAPAAPTAGDHQGMCTQRRAVMHALASAYLPLVPRLREPKDCLIPLWACAKTGYGWGQGQGDELALAEELLRRLAQGGCEMVYRGNGQDLANLFWSLSEAPSGVAERHAELLAASATRLVEMWAEDIGPQACANILLACARLLPDVDIGDPEPLLHHLTRCLVQLRGDANEQDLANAVYALGRLHERCGHVPLPEHLQGLAAAVLQWLSGQDRHESDRFTPQALSNMLWSCTKLRYAHP